MTVHEIFYIWKTQWTNEEIRCHGKYRFPEILYKIRESNTAWNIEDINVFVEYLTQTDKKWFVANLFAIQEKIHVIQNKIPYNIYC